jgi:hypothetical protein
MTDSSDKQPGTDPAAAATAVPRVWKPEQASGPAPQPKEIGGREGPEPVRFGDWEKNGRCIDF